MLESFRKPEEAAIVLQVSVLAERKALSGRDAMFGNQN